MKMVKVIEWVAVAFVVFVLALGLLGCSGGQGYSSLATGKIAGTVKDETNIVIAGATVVVEEADLSAITDADGYYILEDIPVGTYDVATFADNHYPQAATVTVEKDEIVVQDFIIPQAIQVYTVSGTVMDRDMEGPLGGATVTIEGTGWSTTTGDDGGYSILDVEAGIYSITASKAGYTNQTEAIAVESNTTVGFELIALVLHYGLSIESTAGVSVNTPGEGTFVYEAGTAIDLVAEAEDGYRFVEWTGDVDTVADVGAAATNIMMSGNYSIMAVSVAVNDLSISGMEGGSVSTPGGGTFVYDAGTLVELVATPYGGYRFVGWTGDVDTIADVGAAATNITMSGDYSIHATFEEVAVASVVSIQSLIYTTTGGPDNDKHLNITVLLLDNLGDPVAGASVSAALYRDDGKSWNFSGKTDSNGTVIFKRTNHKSGCYLTVVTDVQAEGLEWDSVTPGNSYCKE
jgi:hypothetical protein